MVSRSTATKKKKDTAAYLHVLQPVRTLGLLVLGLLDLIITLTGTQPGGEAMGVCGIEKELVGGGCEESILTAATEQVLYNSLAGYVKSVFSEVSLQGYFDVASLFSQLPRVGHTYMAFGSYMAGNIMAWDALHPRYAECTIDRRASVSRDRKAVWCHCSHPSQSQQLNFTKRVCWHPCGEIKMVC
jgi:hypothetical protein